MYLLFFSKIHLIANKRQFGKHINCINNLVDTLIALTIFLKKCEKWRRSKKFFIVLMLNVKWSHDVYFAGMIF